MFNAAPARNGAIGVVVAVLTATGGALAPLFARRNVAVGTLRVTLAERLVATRGISAAHGGGACAFVAHFAAASEAVLVRVAWLAACGNALCNLRIARGTVSVGVTVPVGRAPTTALVTDNAPKVRRRVVATPGAFVTEI